MYGEPTYTRNATGSITYRLLRGTSSRWDLYADGTRLLYKFDSQDRWYASSSTVTNRNVEMTPWLSLPSTSLNLSSVDGKLAARSWALAICPVDLSLPAGLIAQDHSQRFVEGQLIPGGRPYWIYNDTDAAMPWWG